MPSLRELIEEFGTENTNLHIHTTRSDGEALAYIVGQEAVKQEMGLIGYSDHNILPLLETYLNFKTQPEYKQIKIIPAIELDTHDLSVGKVHIIGYFDDPFNNIFSTNFRDRYEEIENIFLKDIRKGTTEKVKIAVDRFNQYVKDHPGKLKGEGEITFEEVVEAAIKRKHLLNGIDKPEVASFDLFEPLKNKGYFCKRKKAKKFLRKKKLIPQRTDIGCYVPSADDAMEILKYLGATDIVFAHPGSNVKKVGFYNVDVLVKRLTHRGLTGIEVITPKNSEDVRIHYSELAQKYDLVPTIGGDNHSLDEVSNLRVI